ncbi:MULTISPECIES: hypothetical protein [Halorussus]|uniref:hypothetical protein n=1 Tax=Halorussus TaxID=1070314 RepID=UPI000E20DB77|nr:MULTISPECIES: hypothetical protein [Halorussus]NHN60175.1 hypothetical protein [Halorussus sp. JP-T4]
MKSHYATLAVCLVALAAASTGFTAAAGQDDGATVRLVAADDSIDPGDAATYDVVVEGVDGTVGAYQLTLALADSDVGTIVDVRAGGEPRMSDVSIVASGTEATVAAVGATVEPDDGAVIASVTVSAGTVGTSALDLTVDALGDADGAAYDVATATGANVTVQAERDDSSGWNDGWSSDAGADDGSTDRDQSTADESAVDDAPAASTEDGEIASAETTDGSTPGGGSTGGSAGSLDSTAETTAADGRATTADAVDRTTGGASGATPGFGAATAVAALAAALVALRRLQ